MVNRMSMCIGLGFCGKCDWCQQALKDGTLVKTTTLVDWILHGRYKFK